jgi:hypothetical protein
MLIAIVTFFGFWWLQYFIQRRAFFPDEKGAFLGNVQFEFAPDGFHSRRSNAHTFFRWSFVREITETADHVFLWIDTISAYVVPVRDLPDSMTAPAAVARLREFMAAAVEHGVGSGSSTPPTTTDAAAPDRLAPAAIPQLPTVAQELLALLRLQSWGLVDRARLFGRDATIFLLGLFSFVLWAGLDRLNYESEVEIFWYTIAENAALVVAVLLLAWLLSRASRPRIRLRQSLLLLLGYLPLFVVAAWIALKLPKVGTIVIVILACGWADRYLGAGMRSLTGKRQQLAVIGVLVAVLLMFYLSTRLYFSPGIWFEREPNPEQAEATQRENEQLVFEQSARLTTVIGLLAPRDAKVANAFFVGFAGFGGQSVFADEITLAAKRIGARYGARDRSVLLINDHRDAAKYPLASVPSLRYALKSLAERMNVDEDVLFLSLSSHGSEDATISVSSEVGNYWQDLRATDLADILRESGIRWKVIVISACHAGSFIDALRDESTIILTAAAAERTSFGCSDDRDLTYFGEAFYRDALPQAASLREAFEISKAALRKREIGEARIPSNPQAHFGAALEKKLAAMEAARIAALPESGSK